jgi:predicted SAM-dependent methyltransferase
MMSAPILRPLGALVQRAIDLPISAVARFRLRSTPEKLKKFDKLHLGSGGRIIDGWANIDITGLRTIPWDLRNPLPLAPGQVRFVYSEHFIEHIDRDAARRLLSRVRGGMAPGAVIRVSTPDLAKLVGDYQAGRIVRMEHGGWFPETPCRMVNQGMRLWGHVFVYDEPELVSLLEECGFSGIRRVKRGESDHPEFRGLESRPDFGDLILEARA